MFQMYPWQNSSHRSNLSGTASARSSLKCDRDHCKARSNAQYTRQLKAAPSLHIKGAASYIRLLKRSVRLVIQPQNATFLVLQTYFHIFLLANATNYQEKKEKKSPWSQHTAFYGAAPSLNRIPKITPALGGCPLFKSNWWTIIVKGLLVGSHEHSHTIFLMPGINCMMDALPKRSQQNLAVTTISEHILSNIQFEHYYLSVLQMKECG